MKDAAMNGLMMQQPLLISSLLVHAERHHGDQQIVSHRVEGDLHRMTYRELAARSRRLAKALAALGVQDGDRVGTLAWNGHRHLELYYAVSGSGAVLHTLNPRLHPDQLVWIADHAEDQVLCFDASFLPLVEAVADRVSTVRHFVLMTDRAHVDRARVLQVGRRRSAARRLVPDRRRRDHRRGQLHADHRPGQGREEQAARAVPGPPAVRRLNPICSCPPGAAHAAWTQPQSAEDTP